MVNKRTIPDAMEELIHNEKTLNMFRAWPTEMRCQYIYMKTEHEGWPVERSCALFDISSVWYRNRVMRNRDQWEQECQTIIEDTRQYNDFLERATQIIGIDFSIDENSNWISELVFSITEYHLQEKEGIFEYNSVPEGFFVEAGLLFRGETTREEFIRAANVLANQPAQTNSKKYTHMIQTQQNPEAQVS